MAKWCGPLCAGRAFYICAPPEVMDHTIPILRRGGVPPGRIHFERFSL